MGRRLGVNKLGEKFRVPVSELGKRIRNSHRCLPIGDGASAATHPSVANNETLMLKIHEHDVETLFAVRSKTLTRNEEAGLPERIGALAIYDINQKSFHDRLKNDDKFDATIVTGITPIALKGKITVYKVTKNEHKMVNAVDAAAVEAPSPSSTTRASTSTATAESSSSAGASSVNTASVETLAPVEASAHVSDAAAHAEASSVANAAVVAPASVEVSFTVTNSVSSSSPNVNNSRVIVHNVWKEILQHEKDSTFAVRSKKFPKANGVVLPEKVGDLPIYDIIGSTLTKRLKKDDNFDAIAESSAVPAGWQGKITVYKVIKNVYKSATNAAEAPASTGAAAWPEILQQEKDSTFAVRAELFAKGMGGLPKKLGELPIYDISLTAVKNKLKNDDKFDAIVMKGAAPIELKGKVTVYKVTKNEHKIKMANAANTAVEAHASAEASVTTASMEVPAASLSPSDVETPASTRYASTKKRAATVNEDDENPAAKKLKK